MKPANEIEAAFRTRHGIYLAKMRKRSALAEDIYNPRELSEECARAIEYLAHECGIELEATVDA